jgi:tRNA modification GTPase
LGSVVSPSSGRLLDRAMTAWFPGPGSFTGEDSAEIQCHGGGAVPRLILEALMETGARLARPGEFTERAFLNGRLSLDQAEAVAEIVAAESEAEAAIAARALAGALARRVEPLSRALLSVQAALAGALDFEEDWTGMDDARLAADLCPVERGLSELLELRRGGKIFRDGAKAVLAGPPNSGKSSLFNALLGSRRALVSKVAGTTRDYLTASVSWGQVKVELVDTAGLRGESGDELEAMGMDLALEQMAQADLVLWLRDPTLPDGGPAPGAACGGRLPSPDPEAAGAGTRPAPGLPPLSAGGAGAPRPPAVLEVWNKLDLDPASPLPPPGALRISAATGEGLPELRRAALALLGAEGARVPEIVPNLRQEKALEGALGFIRKAMASAEAGEVPEITAILLKEARDSLDLVTGRLMTEDLLAEVFSRFCLGK